ncbi:MAG: 4-alpha-glucanotransferase, partial [Candidatus Thermoplasmatota archaeon]|nr:4-alpha-glucanotransferase [Candidatus Thermoplasmatota archaeon]
PHRILAEDLGIIPAEVVNLRRRFNLQGMAVLQFGFDGNATNPHQPNGIQADQNVYTGTHDNNTTRGWWETLDAKVQRRVRGLMMPDETPTSAMIRLACESGGAMAMLPLQDLLELGASARMNTPGTHQENWSWRFAWSDLERAKNASP